MKAFLFIIWLLGTSLFVNGQTHDIKVKPKRQIIIEELYRLKTILSSNDKDKFKEIYKFPIADTLIDINSYDKNFEFEKKQNLNFITDKIFDKYFLTISKGQRIQEFTSFFQSLQIDSLKFNDNLKSEIVNKGNPCSKFYIIDIEDDYVKLILGNKSNNNSKRNDKAEVECNLGIVWLFKLENNKLVFKQQFTVG